MQTVSPSALTTSLLVALLLWAPLPFASVTPGFRLLLGLGSLLVLSLALFSGDWKKVPRRSWSGVLALAGLGLWAILQSLSLPRSWVALASPKAVDLTGQAMRMLETPVPNRLPLSLAPSTSLDLGLWLLTLAAAGGATLVAARRRDHRRWLLAALVISGLFQSLYGARRWAAGATEIWGVAVPGTSLRLRGSFINPDHLALYLELVLAASTAWIFWTIQRLPRLSSLERKILQLAAPVITWVTLFACLAFTGSRAGLVASITATILQGALLALGRRQRRWLPTGLALGAAGLATVAFLGLRAGFGRWLATSSYELTWNVRREVYAAAWNLIPDFRWSGIGLGAFTDAFPLVQPSSVAGLWTHAHNDWLELVLSAGWPVALLFLGALVLLVRQLLANVSSKRRTEDRAAAIAALGALAATGLHACLDFGLAMPANAFTLVVLCAAGAAIPRRYRGSEFRKEE